MTGYTGLELLRLLLGHPLVEIGFLTSRQHEDAPLGDVATHLAHLPMRVTNTPHEKVAVESDVVFLCLPHKTTAEIVPSLIGKCRIIDMSADFRLDDQDSYRKYYGQPHPCPDLIKRFVYGLPEIFREEIRTAENIANPGCFALLAQLLLHPFRGNIETAHITAVTGSSGLGRSPAEAGHHPVRNHNMKGYSINAHRHIPEIIRSARIAEEQLDFVPVSGPFTRGIFATAFIRLEKEIEPPGHYYSGHPFIREDGEAALANVTGSNFADLSFSHGHGGKSVIARGAIDNLMKGASGTAVQNMNLMFGLNETEGLNAFSPLYP